MSLILADLLHKMLIRQLIAGDETIEHNVHFLLIDKKFTAAVLFSTDVDQTIFKEKEAFADLWIHIRYLIFLTVGKSSTRSERGWDVRFPTAHLALFPSTNGCFPRDGQL